MSVRRLSAGWHRTLTPLINGNGNEQVIKTALANPLDKFELGIRKLVEDFMIERMGENDKIVTRYMADRDFQASAFPILAQEIFTAVRAKYQETNQIRQRQ